MTTGSTSLDLIDEFGEKRCILGGLLYGECAHVQRRQQTLQFTHLQDSQALEQAEAKRQDAQRVLDGQKKRLRTEIDRLSQERHKLQINRDALLAGIRAKREELRDLNQGIDQLKTWTERRDKPGQYEQLDKCQERLAKTITMIDELKSQLTGLLTLHDDNRKLLASIFSGAVRTVLPSGAYDGQVDLDNRELAFRITHGPAMSGEAVETLSVLLADVACLVYNSASERARLPGFLLHDSPREADLGARIYRSFIRLLAALQGHFGSPDRCPFQYILTTTTAPPEELQKEEMVRLRLNAAVTDELFFRRNIAMPLATLDTRQLL